MEGEGAGRGGRDGEGRGWKSDGEGFSGSREIQPHREAAGEGQGDGDGGRELWGKIYRHWFYNVLVSFTAPSYVWMTAGAGQPGPQPAEPVLVTIRAFAHCRESRW